MLPAASIFDFLVGIFKLTRTATAVPRFRDSYLHLEFQIKESCIP